MKAEFEKLLRGAAIDYTEQEGIALQKELESADSLPVPGLDKKLRGKLFRLKYKVHMRAAAALAACLALVLILPPVLQQQTLQQWAAPAAAPPAPAAAPMTGGGAAIAEAEQYAAEFFAADSLERQSEIAPMTDAPAPPQNDHWGADNSTTAVPPEPQAAVDWFIPDRTAPPCLGIPLGFELPQGFYKSHSYERGERTGFILQYGERSIHLIRGYAGLFEPAQEWPESFIATFETLQLNGYTIYYRQEGELPMPIVAFEKDAIFYDIRATWDTEIETLITLARAIIAG